MTANQNAVGPKLFSLLQQFLLRSLQRSQSPLGLRSLEVANKTLKDQQQIDRDQLELNKIAREQNQRRYASRVAWWHDTELYDQQRTKNRNVIGVVRVQNRSPVPILNVRLYFTGSSAWEPRRGHSENFKLKRRDYAFRVTEPIAPCRVVVYEAISLQGPEVEVDRTYNYLGNAIREEIFGFPKAGFIGFMIQMACGR